jgi:hypothetical protein
MDKSKMKENETMTAQQAAALWGVSDRRVCALCSQGKIPGAVKAGKSYQIPADAKKPADGRERAARQLIGERYLKWDDDVIGIIHEAGDVSFVASELNDTVAQYSRGKNMWSPELCFSKSGSTILFSEET